MRILTKFKFLILTVVLGLIVTGISYAQVSGPNFWNLISGVLQPTNSSYNVRAPANLRFDGEIQPDGSTCSNGQVLQRAGANDWDCVTPAAGSVTSVSASVPTGLQVSGVPITTSGTIAITLQSGYVIPLSASTTEWSNLNTNVLSRLNVATGTTGTIFNISTSSNSIIINLPLSSASVTGQLSATDWSTFNNKLSSIGSGNPGFLSRWNGSNTLAQGLIRDNGTVAGINATSSTVTFNVQGTAGNISPIVISSSTGNAMLTVGPNGTTTIANLGVGSVYSTSGGSLYVNSVTGTGSAVQQTSPTLVTPILGVASGTALTLSNNLWVTGTLNVGATTTLEKATTTINGVNYYWPSAQSVGTKILQNDGTGQLSWVADQTGGGGSLSGGTAGFAAIWASSTAVTIGTLRDNGTVSGVNATSSTVNFNIQGTTTLNPFNVSSSTGDSILRVGVNSRVGINTTTPEATLTVQGITSSPTVEPFVIASSSGQQLLVVLPSGKVGIGSNISTPLTRLQVGNSNEISATPSQLFFGEYSNSSGWPTFLGNWTSTGLWAFGPDSGSADNVLRIGVTPGNTQGWSVNQSAFKVAIGDSIFGNSVGIGSTSPIATLVVKGTSTAPTVSPLIIASSTGVSMFQIASNGSTTLSSLGTGCVGVSSGSLYTTSCGGAGSIDGTGAPGLVATWSDADTLTTGLFRDNGTVAGINATSSTVLFNVQGTSGSTNNIFNVSSSTGISILTATSNQRVGVGSSTPIATFVVQGTSTYPTVKPFIIASSSGAELITVTPTGRLGIGSSTPLGALSVVGDFYQNGTYARFGSAMPIGTCGGQSCLEVWGDDNTTAGVSLLVGNRNSGTSAYTQMLLLNDIAGNTANFAGLFLNSSTYTDTTFGNAVNKTNQLLLQNTMGPVTITSATTTSGEYINFLVGSNNVDGEAMRITDSRRVGIGTSSPVATLTVRGTSTAPTIYPLVIASSSGASLFVVTNAGKVGVGSNTPTSLFTVDNNTTNATTTLFIESLGTKGTCVVIKDADGSGYTYVSANNGALLIGTGSCE